MSAPKWMHDKAEIAVRLNIDTASSLPRIATGQAAVIAATAGFTEAEIHPAEPPPGYCWDCIGALITGLDNAITELAGLREAEEEASAIRDAQENRDYMLWEFGKAVVDRIAGKPPKTCDGCVWRRLAGRAP